MGLWVCELMGLGIQMYTSRRIIGNRKQRSLSVSVRAYTRFQSGGVLKEHIQGRGGGGEGGRGGWGM